ncbi:hypothetical protein SD70_09075 [Gordoniibacillus kamchatkensis]|uniref:YgiT-type zinc finger protein n=1 Tax=Gordoniibacillus kamchatkensis TaxID=1590651 RepID=A0ABR5AJJ9_9BACL|nr:hypothetical protein [Paenibacillus sp. VKM B-2647]KIL41206.1 hypothetical protein SD70_09075 [Paenibacillus sp. VKM B-2647]
MQKLCKCGTEMTLRLRTVIYQNKVDIENVPVYSCDSCQRSEVLPSVKPELTVLIGRLGSEPGKQQLLFDELSEIAYLMRKVSEKEHQAQSVERIVQERINELLDMMLIAKSVGDERWSEEIRARLAQISQHSISA